MDGVREAVYSGKKPEVYAVHKLNDIARELTGELDLPFLDLQDVFAAHYAREHRHFEFPFDWHWNVLGNQVAGEAIGRWLLSDPTSASSRAAPVRTTPRASSGKRAEAQHDRLG